MDGADVVAVLEEVGGEGMTKGMGADEFLDLGAPAGFADGALDDGFVEMVSVKAFGVWVSVGSGGGEEPLPLQLGGCGWVLANEGVWQPDEPGAPGQVDGVLFAHAEGTFGVYDAAYQAKRLAQDVLPDPAAKG